KVFPESVKGSGEYLAGDKKEILQVDTYNSQVISIKALQELVKLNEAQAKEIENLKIEIGKLRTDNGKINVKVREHEDLKNEIDIIKAKIGMELTPK
ncbi:MAG: hypothetical protein ABIQ56_07575, partial [Chitinophagaceae bacterium]